MCPVGYNCNFGGADTSNSIILEMEIPDNIVCMKSPIVKDYLSRKLSREKRVLINEVGPKEVTAADILTSEDFYQKQYGIFFEAMVCDVKLNSGNYINASFISCPSTNYFIATQGPLETTIVDFWEMRRAPTSFSCRIKVSKQTSKYKQRNRNMF